MFDALEFSPQPSNTVPVFSTDTISSAATASTPYKRKFLVLFATGSVDKIYNFNAIARLLGLPITFVSYKTLMSFHSTDEEKGNRLAHAHDKQAELNQGIELMRTSPTNRKALEKLCTFLNIPFDEQNIYFATEDSSFSLIKRAWVRARKEFGQYIPSGIIKNAEKDIDKDASGTREYMGPGSELAPVLTSMGGVLNLIKTALTGRDPTIPDEAVLTSDASTFVIRRLDSSPLEPVKDFTGKHFHQIIANTEYVLRNAVRWHDSTAQRLTSAEQPEASFADKIKQYFKQHSARTHVVKQLFEHINTSPYAPPSAKEAKEIEKRAAMILTEKRSFNVRIMAGTAELLSHKKQLQGFAQSKAKEASPYAQMMQSLDLSMNFTDKTDAFVYGPFDNTNKAALRRVAYRFFSSLDERLLEMESMGKPIVVANDGSYNSIIDAYLYLVDVRMANDFDLIPEYEKTPEPLLERTKKNTAGAIHKGFGLFDCVQSEDEKNPASRDRINNSVNAVLNARKREYIPFVGIPIGNIRTLQKQNRRDDIFKVAMFTSATCDNRVLLEQNHRLVVGVGKLGAGIVWGGGDRHGMGAIYNACLEKGIYVEGFSPPSIIVAETKLARMPECNYSEISQNIFDRMAKMIEASDVITITPGGFGTLQEMLAILVLMDEKPELMKNKSLVVHNPHLYGETDDNKRFWNPIIKSFMGENALKKLLANHRALAGQNIYMTTSVREHDALIGLLKDKWEIDRKLVNGNNSARKQPIKKGLKDPTAT